MSCEEHTSLPEVSVGQILVYRGEFWEINRNDALPVSTRIRASKLVQLLDELIERRRKDADLCD